MVILFVCYRLQVSDLGTTNEFLLDQNAQLRLGVKPSLASGPPPPQQAQLGQAATTVVQAGHPAMVGPVTTVVAQPQTRLPPPGPPPGPPVPVVSMVAMNVPPPVITMASLPVNSRIIGITVFSFLTLPTLFQVSHSSAAVTMAAAMAPQTTCVPVSMSIPDTRQV